MKNLLNLGKALNKVEQKQINGGRGGYYIGSGCGSTCDDQQCRSIGIQYGLRGRCATCTDGSRECRLFG